MAEPMGRRKALAYGVRSAGGLVGLTLPTLCGCAVRLRRAATTQPPPSATGSSCVQVEVGGLWPGLSAHSTDAVLSRLHLTDMGAYCYRAAAHGPGDAVLVTQAWYPVMVGVVPGSVGVTLAPLDEALRLANFNTEMLVAGLGSVFVDRQRRFALPLGWLPVAVFANTTLLQALGLPAPPEAPTLADLLVYCRSVRAELVRTKIYRRDAGMQVLSRRDMVDVLPTLLATFIAGFGGDVTRTPSVGQTSGPGVAALADLLANAGGTDGGWSEGTAVLTIAAGVPTARIPAQVSRFPELPRPIQPIEVCGLGCSVGFAARADAVAVLGTALLGSKAQRAISAVAGVNPAAAALSGLDTWVPHGLRTEPLTRIPPGWAAAWDIGVFQGPIWESALSTVAPALTSDATTRSIAAALGDAIASGVRATAAATPAGHA